MAKQKNNYVKNMAILSLMFGPDVALAIWWISLAIVLLAFAGIGIYYHFVKVAFYAEMGWEL